MREDIGTNGRMLRRADPPAGLPLGPWARETLGTPHALAQGALSSLTYVTFRLLTPESHAAILGPLGVAMIGVCGVLIALRLWARPGGQEPLEVDRGGVWIAARDAHDRKTRRHIAFAEMHVVRARRGWISFLDARGDTLFVVRGTEHHNASLIADAARAKSGEHVVLPGVSPNEAFRIGSMLLGYVATVCWMLLMARAPSPFDWLVALAIVPTFGLKLWHQARRLPSIDLTLRPPPTYRES